MNSISPYKTSTRVMLTALQVQRADLGVHWVLLEVHWTRSSEGNPAKHRHWFCVDYFYAPLEKGGILFCNCRSIGLSVGWYVGRYVSLSICRPSDVLSISFDPLHFINSKLRAGVALNEYMIPIDFQVTCLKVQVKLLFWAHCVVRSISFDPFLGAGVAPNK